MCLALVPGSVACGGSDAESVEAEAGQAATSPAASEPVVLSFLGEVLEAPPDTSGQVAAALEAVAAAPDDVETLLEAGHAHARVQDYIGAIRLYNRAAAVAPDDWRPYRYRGHRFISIRRLPSAVQDLEAARDLAPHSFDVAYHLGLAYYLSGAYEAAAEEYGRCMALAADPEAVALEDSGALGDGFRSCMSVGPVDNTRVAITEWRYLALRRAGREDEARALLDGISSDMDVETNVAYHHVLLFYKGEIAEGELLADDNPAGYRLETVGYPVAAWHLAEGDTTRALTLLEAVAAHPHWPGFGRIAAEAELSALRRGDVR